MKRNTIRMARFIKQMKRSWNEITDEVNKENAINERRNEHIKTWQILTGSDNINPALQFAIDITQLGVDLSDEEQTREIIGAIAQGKLKFVKVNDESFGKQLDQIIGEKK